MAPLQKSPWHCQLDQHRKLKIRKLETASSKKRRQLNYLQLTLLYKSNPSAQKRWLKAMWFAHLFSKWTHKVDLNVFLNLFFLKNIISGRLRARRHDVSSLQLVPLHFHIILCTIIAPPKHLPKYQQAACTVTYLNLKLKSSLFY